MKNKKESILEAYKNICLRLGKLVSRRELHKFGITKDLVDYHFDNHSKLKNALLEKHPELEELSTPAKLHLHDIQEYRYDIEKKITKKENKILVADASVLDYISKFAKDVFSGKVLPSVNVSKSKHPTKRVHTLVLSDLHIGSDLKSDETGAQDYGVIEESRRLASIIQQASLYKEQYRDVTSLKLLLLGDIIENQLHDPRTGAVLAEQVCRAIHLIIQAVSYLSNFYNLIEIECSSGNHGRNTSRHRGRAIHQKFDSIETIIYYSIKEALINLKNVKVNIPKTPLSYYEVFGKKIAYTHGDTVLSPGNPGKKLEIQRLENQVNRINAALPDHEEYSAFVYGHTHVPHIVFLGNGTVLVGNGSLPAPDHFTVSLGILEAMNGQWIFESVEGHAVGDQRLLKINKQYDKDESLDSIIKPWYNF